jgi:hypothetical protein
MQGFSVESKTSGISSSSTLWQDLEARTSHVMKQTWLQEARDSTREDDKLRGPNQKSAESCGRRSDVQLGEKLMTRAYMQKGKHLEGSGTDTTRRRPGTGPGWAQAGWPSPCPGPNPPSFDLATIRDIYSPGLESHAVDAKSAPRAKHTASRKKLAYHAWWFLKACQSIFLKLTKG